MEFKKQWMNKFEGISKPAWVFAFFLLMFPLDSALGDLLGRVSVNNYIALICVALIVINYAKLVLNKDCFMKLFFVYFAYQLLAILYGGKIFSDRNVIFVFYGVMAFLVLSYQWTEKEKDFFCRAILISMVLTCIVVLVNIDFGSSGRLYLALSRNIDQNYLCANLIFGTALIMNSVFVNKEKKVKIALLILLLVEIVCIVFLGSRGSLLGNLAVIAVAVLVNRKYILAKIKIPENLTKKQKIVGGLALLAGCACAVGLLLIILPDWIVERFNIINMLRSGGAGRLDVWKGYLEYYMEGSVLNKVFGFGRGVIHGFYVLGKLKCTHSIYMKALVEGGIVGFVLLILLFGGIVYYIVKSKNTILLSIVAGYCLCGVFLDLDDYRIFSVLIMIVGLYAKHPYYVIKKEKNDINNSSSV